VSTSRFHPEARQDFDETVFFLAGRSPAAALGFVSRVTEIIDLIGGFPEAGNQLVESIRAFPIHPYSHDLVYRIEPGGQITILAVAHHRRRPMYWLHRAE
jgi:toxin ParE1/3/4